MKTLSNIKGTVGNVFAKRMKDIERESKNGTRNIASFIEGIFKEEGIESNPYTVEVLNAMRRESPYKQLALVCNVVLKGDGLGVL